jgi:hypothetical protein
MNDPSPSVPPPSGTAPRPERKGPGPLGWTLIGCGGLILLAGLLFAGLMAAGDFHRRIAKRWQEEQRHQRQEQTSPQKGPSQH